MTQNNLDRTVAFIPVRLTSTRLPEKHLRAVGPKSIISWVIYRLKQAKEIDEIVICAPNEPETERLRPVALAEGVELFIYNGGVDDVVGRLTRAAEEFNAVICVLASGDCPLLSTKTIDSMVGLLKANPSAGHIAFTPVNGTMPIHEGIVISRLWLWQRAEQCSDTPPLREHHFPAFLRGVYPEKFADVQTIPFIDDECFYSLRHRISVDTPLDLEFMNTLYERLKLASLEFTLVNAIALIKSDTDIGKINSGVYQKGFDEASYRVLFAVSQNTAGLSMLLDIADALVHYHGIGAAFLTSDKRTATIISQRGHNAIEGTHLDLLKLSMRYTSLIVDITQFNDKDLETLREAAGQTPMRLILLADNEDGALAAAKNIARETSKH
ncbi:MAG: hypothetical protein L7F77_15480 [Candidatus Magnetominusculus sp. LBB02]|nr:hypothetical protein [Candidatus Magnetominusculus sp. LBB02]